MALSETGSVNFPFFIKPVVPKLLRAGIYNNLSELESECTQLESVIGIGAGVFSFITVIISFGELKKKE